MTTPADLLRHGRNLIPYLLGPVGVPAAAVVQATQPVEYTAEPVDDSAITESDYLRARTELRRAPPFGQPPTVWSSRGVTLWASRLTPLPSGYTPGRVRWVEIPQLISGPSGVGFGTQLRYSLQSTRLNPGTTGPAFNAMIGAGPAEGQGIRPQPVRGRVSLNPQMLGHMGQDGLRGLANDGSTAAFALLYIPPGVPEGETLSRIPYYPNDPMLIALWYGNVTEFKLLVDPRRQLIAEFVISPTQLPYFYQGPPVVDRTPDRGGD